MVLIARKRWESISCLKQKDLQKWHRPLLGFRIKWAAINFSLFFSATETSTKFQWIFATILVVWNPFPFFQKTLVTAYFLYEIMATLRFLPATHRYGGNFLDKIWSHPLQKCCGFLKIGSYRSKKCRLCGVKEKFEYRYHVVKMKENELVSLWSLSKVKQSEHSWAPSGGRKQMGKP